MKNLFQAKLKPLFLVCLIGIFGFWFQVQAQIYENPGVYVTGLEIAEVKDRQIKGEFSVWNSESYYLADLNYEIILFRGADISEFELIDKEVVKEKFFIAPNQKISKPFSYKYPQNIISGSYTLRIGIITEKGTELGWKDVPTSLEGKNKFLDIDSSLSKVLVRGEEFAPLIGIEVLPTEEVAISLKVKNLGDDITVIPYVKVFKRQVNMDLVSEYEEIPITFAKEEEKIISLEMPKFDLPESYLAQVGFYKDKEAVSGVQYFRWVVKGEGGKILFIKINKDHYKAGENIELTIDTIGPADLSDIGTGKLEVTVYDREGNIVGQTLRDVSLKSDLVSSKIMIPVENDLIFPKIEAKLIKAENVLDEYKIGLPLFSEEAKEIEKTQKEEIEKIKRQGKIKSYIPYLILVILLVIGFLIYKFVYKPKIKT